MKKYYMVSGIAKDGTYCYDCKCYETREQAEQVGQKEYLKYKITEKGD